MIAKKVGAVALKKGLGAAAKTGAKFQNILHKKAGKMAAMKAVGGEIGKGAVRTAGSIGKSAYKRILKGPQH